MGENVCIIKSKLLIQLKERHSYFTILSENIYLKYELMFCLIANHFDYTTILIFLLYLYFYIL